MNYFLLVGIYFFALLAIGLWTKHKETTSEFLIADRKVGVLQTTASIFAVAGAVMLVGQAALAYDLGFIVLWLWVGISLGFIILGLFVHKIKDIADRNNFLTLSDYIFTKYDYKSGALSAIILFLALFALLIGQFIAGANLFAPLLEISYSTAVVILGLGALVYLLLGGFKAVIKTDFFQFLIMATVLILIFFNLDLGGYSSEQFNFISGDGVTIASLFLMGLFTIFGGADLLQRVFSAKDAKTIKRASYFASVLFLLLGVVITFLGVAAKSSFPDIDSAEALFFGLFVMMPESLVGLMVVMILAAIMSTIDTELFYLSSSIAKDFFYRRNTQTNNEQLKAIIYRSLVVLAFLSMLIAIFFSDIILILFILLSLTLCVAPTIIASLFWKLKSNAVFLSMITAFLSLVVLLVLGQLNPDTAVITLPTAIVFLLLGQIIFKHKQLRTD